MLTRTVMAKRVSMIHYERIGVQASMAQPGVYSRAFSTGGSDSGGPDPKQDWQQYLMDNGIKTFEQVNDLLFPADQVKRLSNQEIAQEIVRANHLAQLTLSQVGSGLKKSNGGESSKVDGQGNQDEDEAWGDDFYSEYKELHSSQVDDLQSKINHPEIRSRPSVISIFAPAVLTGISVVNTKIFGEERAKKVLAGIEKGIQNECDEHLRIMNERSMTGRADPGDLEAAADASTLERDKEIRKTVLNIRDESYDFLERQQLIVDDELDSSFQQPQQSSMPQDQFYLYQAAKYATMGAMRAARKI